MEIVDAHQLFDVFFVSNIPKGKEETHLQKIIESHYTGSLIALTKPRGKSKKQTTTAIVTIPSCIVQNDPLLQKALLSDKGVPISSPPLSKVYFRKKRDQKASVDASVVSLQKEVERLKSVIKEMKALHIIAMQKMTHKLESQTEKLEETLAAQERMGKHLGRVCEFINSLQNTL